MPLRLAPLLTLPLTPPLTPPLAPRCARALQDYITKLMRGQLAAMEATEADLARVRPRKSRGKAQQQEQQEEQQEEEEEDDGMLAMAADEVYAISEAARNVADAPVGNADVLVPGNDVAEVEEEEQVEEVVAKGKGKAAKGKGKKRDGAAAEEPASKKGRRK
jgi:hypothetical protein